jgi:hypothetical protein
MTLIMTDRKLKRRAQTRQELWRLVCGARIGATEFAASRSSARRAPPYDLMLPRRASYHLLETVGLGA